MRKVWGGLAALSALVWALAEAAAIPAAPVVDHLDAAAAALDERAAAVLARMPDPARRLLAARSYLRAGPGLAERWSWSEAQAQAFAQSAGKAALDAAIARVNCAFTAANPGHDLFVNPQFRSLDIQLQRWNQNDSVGRAAAHLFEAATVAAAGFEPATSAAGRRQFSDWLRRQQPRPVPTLAAPGLSPHGQARAVDFQIRRGGRVIAGAVAASLQQDWHAAGWTQKLSAAVSAAGEFSGPLQTPEEPWHYTYQPLPGKAAAAATVGPACGR